jgi:Cap4 SAVED domain
MITFEILIDDAFANTNNDATLSLVHNKNVLSLINTFEDGAWRFENFQNFIWDNIAETSLSFEERKSLIGNPRTLLTLAAKNLRLTDKKDDIGSGSELAEIVLYGIMKHHYKALPVVPKIFHKQNPQDNAKGADSVHIVIENESDFSIWFGEAKFYNNIEDTRLGEIVQSVENSLKKDKIKKEISIITDVKDLDGLITDEKLRNNIKNALCSRESIDDLKPRLHIPILLLHECEITKKHIELTDTYKNQIIEYHKKRSEAYFKKQLNRFSNTVHKYSEIRFHIILFPVPEKKAIVDRFVSNVDFYKNQ